MELTKENIQKILHKYGAVEASEIIAGFAKVNQKVEENKIKVGDVVRVSDSLVPSFDSIVIKIDGELAYVLFEPMFAYSVSDEKKKSLGLLETKDYLEISIYDLEKI